MATFRIRRAFLIPLGILLALLLVLLGVCLVKGQPLAKVLILALLILPVAILFLESLFRKVTIDGKRLRVEKLLRRAEMDLDEVTALETVAVRKRAFLTVCIDDEFQILSNAYARFPELTTLLLERVPTAAISEETRRMAVAPPRKAGDIVSCWLAVLLLLFILYAQLFGRPW